MLKYRRRSALRMFARAFALVAGLAIALGALLSAAQAAPVGMLKQFRVPTADSEPRHIAVGSDGNLWFTEGAEFFRPDPDPETGGLSTTRSERSRPRARSRSFARRVASAS
jgi:streptogramin lyase